MHILRCASMVVLMGLWVLSPASAADSTTEEGPRVLVDVGSPADCAPPCGYIWPRIGVDVDVASPFPVSNIMDFPSDTEVKVTYSWDMEQEGTGINDPTEEMQIVIVVTRTPAFMSAELDRNTCSFMLLPVVSEYEVCTLTLSIRLDEAHLPADEDELRETGHRLMLFAASEESGTFMKSYGLEDIRFRFDEPPSGVESPGGTSDPELAESPAPLFPILVLALMAAFMAARARRG